MDDNANAHPQPSPEEQTYVNAPAPQPYAVGYVPAPQPSFAEPQAPGSGKALAALICGICSIVFSGTVVISVALGVVAIVLAAQYIKVFGKEGKAVAGRICGIVGIVLSVILLMFYLFMGMFLMNAAIDYANSAASRPAVPAVPDAETAPDSALPDTGTKPDSATPGTRKPDSSQAPQSGEKAQALQAVAAELDKVKSPDQDTLQLIAREADREFADDLGFTLTEIGMDLLEFATWLAQDMDYSLAEGDVRLQADGEGEVLVEAQARSFKELVWGLAGDTRTYVNPERLDHGASAPALDEAAKTALSGLVTEAMGNAAATRTTFSVDVVKAGGAWAVERGEFESIVDDVFDL